MLWIKVSGGPIFAANGEFLGYRGISTDVTSRRAAEHAIAESDRRLRELFDVASDWFWETDPEGRFIFLSSNWKNVTGHDPEEFLGRRRQDFGDRAEDPEAWRQHVAVLEARKPFRDFTYCLRSPRGASRWVRTTGVPVFDAKGAFKGYRGAATDVTAEMEARRRAQATHQLLADVIESVPASLMVHDADDRLVVCNRLTRQYCRDSAHLLAPGVKFEDFARAQAESGSIPEAVGRTEQWLRDRMARHRQEESVITRRYADGRWMQIVERRMSDGGTVGIRLDITALKNAEQQHRDLEAQLHHSQKLEALGTLAGGVAHGLNNTLVPILALAKLTMKRLPEQSREGKNLEIILRASEHARDLVNQILAFSRKEAPTRCHVDLAELVAQSLEMLRSSVPSTIRIEQRLAPVPPLLADPGQLHQIIANLVANATQAIGNQLGTIAVELAGEPQPEAHGPLIRLSVSDTGIGMDEATMARIFEPFFTTKPAGEGTGLGLSVVHGIITSHGGRITVESAVGKGTRFDIHLPSG